MSKRIVFVAKHKRSFVEQDLEILSHHYDVTRTVTRENIQDSDLVYCWFASKHAIKPLQWALHYSKPFVVVAGGYDVAIYKGEHKYGLPGHPLYRFIPRMVLENATRILAVSKYTMHDCEHLTRNRNIEYVPNGIPLEPIQDFKKENIILTVGFIDKVSYWRKGLDRFIHLASLMPEYKFYHIGLVNYGKLPRPVLKTIRDAPKNMEFLGYVDDLDEWYKKARVYCQLSRYESFGLAVIEAMKHGCMPVVANSGALPEIVGDYGFVVGCDGFLPIEMDHAMNTPVKDDVDKWLSQYDIAVREKKLVEILG